MPKSTWKTIKDCKVQHIWACDDEACSRKDVPIIVPPTFYMDAGTPLCSYCGEDAVYQRTEIKS